jgi:hypothetical protein
VRDQPRTILRSSHGQEDADSVWYLAGALLAVVFIQNWWLERQRVETIPYSEFETLVNAGKVREVHVSETYVTGTLTEPCRTDAANSSPRASSLTSPIAWRNMA